MMKPLMVIGLLVASVAWSATRAIEAAQTWTGVISDSQCRGSHGGEVDERECTQKCIKNGEKYVLVTDYGANVWAIANQDFAGLAAHPGATVRITGELRDGAIVVATLEAR